MNDADFRPAHEFALNYGVKAICFGKPGSGKSPLCVGTAPNPCVLMCEPGFLSLKGSNVPTYAAFNPARIAEFFAWAKGSAETRKYDTFIIDSASQAAEIIVDAELGGSSKAGNQAHGQQAYGKMSRVMMEYMTQLYFMPQKHIILICKLQNQEVNQGASIYRRPYFPGKELNVRIPHLFDLIVEMGLFNVPGVTPSPVRAVRTKEHFDAMARDRSGKLDEYEQPDFKKIIAKAML